MLKVLPTVMLIGSLLSCASMSSPVRTQPLMRAGEVEFRIENNNWSTARVYTVSPEGDMPVRIATVATTRTEVKRVRVYSNYYVIKIALIGDTKQWRGFTQWSSNEQCLTITIEHFLKHTTVWPCRLDKPE